MTDALTLALACTAGGLIGAMFFGGLWWTVRKGVSSNQPAVWFFGSLMLRMSMALAGFYLVSGGHGKRLLVCLLGFFTASLFVKRLTRPPTEGQLRRLGRDASHASYSR